MDDSCIEAWIEKSCGPDHLPPAIESGCVPNRELALIDTIMGISSPPPDDGTYIVNDLEATPRAKSPSKRRRVDVSITNDTPSLDDKSSRTGSSTTNTTGGSRSKRTRNPVKSISDLRLTEKAVKISYLQRPDQLPSDVVDLFGHVRSVRNGCGIIPLSMEDDIRSALTLMDDQLSEASFYDLRQWAASQELRPWDAAEELKVFNKVVDHTKECDLENMSEAAWNARVYEPLLDFVMESFSGSVRHYDVTRAPINKPYLPRHSTGADVQAKMVDFCLTLSGEDIMITAQRRLKKINDFGSINHTSYQPIRDRPIAVSIETKTPEGSNQEAKAQLSVWTTAHLKRLRSLAGTSHSSFAVGVTLPVISIRGGDWTLLFARDQADAVDLIETFSVGSTKSLVGCYKVAAFLRYLGIWMQTIYREWLLQNALAVDLKDE